MSGGRYSARQEPLSARSTEATTVESLLEKTGLVQRQLEQWRNLFREADFDSDHGATLSRVSAARTKLSQDIHRTLDDSSASNRGLRQQLKQLWEEYQQTVLLIPKLLTALKSEMEKRVALSSGSAASASARRTDSIQVPTERLQQLNAELEELQRRCQAETRDRQKLEADNRALLASLDTERRNARAAAQSAGGSGSASATVEALRVEHRAEVTRLERELRAARAVAPERETATPEAQRLREEVASLRVQLAKSEEAAQLLSGRSGGDTSWASPSPQQPVRGPPGSGGLRRPDYHSDMVAQLEYAHGVVNSLQLVNAQLNRSKSALEAELTSRSTPAALADENSALQARVRALEAEARQAKALSEVRRPYDDRSAKESPPRPSSVIDDYGKRGSPSSRIAEEARLTAALTRAEEDLTDMRNRNSELLERLRLYESDVGSNTHEDFSPLGTRRRGPRTSREVNADLATQRLRLELDTTVERLRQALRDVSGKNDEVDRAMTEKNSALSKLHESELDLLHAQQDIKTAQSMVRTKEGDIARLEDRVQQLTRQTTTMEGTTRDTVAQLQREIEAKVALRNEMGALQRQLETARNEISTFETDLARARKKESTDSQNLESLQQLWQQEKAKLQSQFRMELETEQQRREDAEAAHERASRDAQIRIHELRTENESLATERKQLERQAKTNERILSDAEVNEAELLRLRQNAKEAEWKMQQGQDAVAAAQLEAKRLQVRLQELEGENRVLVPLKEKCKDLTKELGTQADQNQRQEQQIKDCNRKLSHLSELERALELLEQQHQQTLKEKASILETNRLLQQEVAARTTSFHEATLEITRLRQEYTVALEAESRVENEKANTGKELNSARQTVIDLQGEIALLRKKYAAEVRQKDQLDATLAAENGRLKDALTRLETLEGYRDKHDLLALAHQALLGEAEELRGRLDRCERDLKADRRRLDDLATAEATVEDLRGKYRLEQRDKGAVEEKLQAVQAELRALTARNVDTEQKASSLEVRLASEVQSTRLTQEHLGEKELELKATKEQLASMRTAETELAGLREMYNAVVTERNQLKSTVADLHAVQEEISRVQTTNSVLRQDLDKQRELGELHQRDAAATLKDVRQTLETTEGELRDARRHLRTLERVEAENAACQDRIRDLTKEGSSLRALVEAGRVVEDELETTRRRLAAVIQEKQTLVSEVAARDAELRAAQEAQMRLADDQLAELRKQRHETVKTTDASAALIDGLEHQVTELQRKVVELTPLIKLAEDQSRALAEAAAEQQRSNEQLSRLRHAAAERDKVQEMYDELNLRAERTASRLHILEADVKEEREQLDASNASVARATSKYTDALKANEFLRAEVESTIASLQHAQQQLAEYKGVKEEAESIASHLADSVRENRMLRDRIERLEAASVENERLSQTVSQDKHDIDRLTDERQSLQRDLEAARLELSSARHDLHAVREALSTRERAHDSLATEKTAAAVQAEQLRQQLAEMRVKADGESTLRERLEATVTSLTADRDRLERQAGEAGALARQKAQLEQQLAVEQERLTAAQATNTSQNDRVRQQEAGLTSLRRELDDARSATVEAERAGTLAAQEGRRAAADRDALQHQLVERDAEIVRVRAELETMAATSAQREPALFAQRQEAETRAKNAEAEVARVKADLEQLQAKKDRNTEFLNNLKRELEGDLAATKGDLDDKARKLKEAQRLLASSLGTIRDLEAQLGAAKTGEGELSGAQRALQERADKLRAEKAGLEADRARLLEEHDRAIAELRRQSLERQNEIRSELGREIERLERALRELTDKRTQLAQDLAAAHELTAAAEKDAIRRQGDSATQQATMLADMAALQAKTASESVSRERTETRLNEANTQISQLRDAMAHEAAGLANLRREHGSVVAQLETAQRENVELAAALQQLTEIVKASNNENEQLVVTNEDVCANLHKMSVIQEETERMLSDATVDNQELLRQCEILSEQGGVLADTVRRSEKRFETASARANELARVNDDVATQLAQLKVLHARTKQQLTETLERDSVLEREVARLEAANDELSKSQRRTERRLTTNLADVEDLRAERDDLQAKLREVQAAL